MHNELDAAARTREATANRYTSVAWLGPLALVWGYNWVVMKIGVEASEPFTFGALSMFLGGVLLVALLLLSRRPARPTPLGPILLVGLLQTSGFFGFAMWSLKNGAAGKTAVLAYAMPFWLILMAWPVLGERVRGLQWLAVVTALAGLVFILSPWHSSGSMASSALAIGSGLSWAAGVIAAKILQRYHRVELLSLTAWQMLLGSVPLIIVAFLSAGTGVKWSSPSLIGSLAYNVVLGAALGYLLWMHIVRTLPTGIAGVGSLATPVVGVASGWIQLGERPTSQEAIGIGLVLLALALLIIRGVAQKTGPTANEMDAIGEKPK